MRITYFVCVNIAGYLIGRYVDRGWANIVSNEMLGMMTGNFSSQTLLWCALLSFGHIPRDSPQSFALSMTVFIVYIMTITTYFHHWYPSVLLAMFRVINALIGTVYLSERSLMFEVGVALLRQYLMAQPLQSYFKHTPVYKWPVCAIEINGVEYHRSLIDIIVPGLIISNQHVFEHGSKHTAITLFILGSILHHITTSKLEVKSIPVSLVLLPTMCIGLYVRSFAMRFKK